MIYHVSKLGSNNSPGTEKEPFLTIQKAADIMVPGDKVIVHEGEYREWVKPRCGGLSDSNRITYEAAPGEKVVIKGSEVITGWKLRSGSVWTATVPNTLFGDYNPFSTIIDGDWLLSPHNPCAHTGEVYLNGKSLYERSSLGEVEKAEPMLKGAVNPFSYTEEYIPHPEDTVYCWYAEVSDDFTTIYANFRDYDPNKEIVEINVRRSCFYPDVNGYNYITVRGFEMCQAASWWSPPTGHQVGLIGPNWAKGWIIENNDIHDAKCSAICLGKGPASGDNDCTKNGRKPGYQTQLEAVFKEYHFGWSFARVGSHIIRNNILHDCGQNGVVGHLGCIGSEIYGNEIYNIGMKYEYFGWEIGGVKLHAALDVKLHNNYIHNCLLGTWLDWQAQGVRVSSNIYDKNVRDLMIEVSHGPYVVDNNIFTSELSFENASQGGAFVNNLVCGFISHYTVPDRSTPYHYPHSTDPLATAPIYGGDDRLALNVFLSGKLSDHEYGTGFYEGYTASMEQYISDVHALGYGDLELYQQVKQPVYLRDNLYCNEATSTSLEPTAVHQKDNLAVNVSDDIEEVYLEIDWSEEAASITAKRVCSCELGETRISGARFENPDGSAFVIDTDLCGNVRNEITHAGPIEGLKAGKNKVLIWKR